MLLCMFPYQDQSGNALAVTAVHSLISHHNRGGASEASVATLTGDVDGSSRYMYMYVCMYTCIKPLGQLLHAHAHMVLSEQFSKFIFTGKGNSGKKKSLAQEWVRTWV